MNTVWTVASIVAQESQESLPGTDTEVFIQYGAMGAFLVVVMTVCYQLIKREAARGDRLEDELRAVNRARIEKEIPVIEQCVGVMSEVTDVMREVSYELRRRGD